MIHSRDQCDKTFPNKSDLIEHARIHSGVKQYKCDQCDETFSQNSSLIAHINIHSGEELYRCNATLRR